MMRVATALEVLAAPSLAVAVLPARARQTAGAFAPVVVCRERGLELVRKGAAVRDRGWEAARVVLCCVVPVGSTASCLVGHARERGGCWPDQARQRKHCKAHLRCSCTQAGRQGGGKREEKKRASFEFGAEGVSCFVVRPRHHLDGSQRCLAQVLRLLPLSFCLPVKHCPCLLLLRAWQAPS
jgi:hypothetical protein